MNRVENSGDVGEKGMQQNFNFERKEHSLFIFDVFFFHI